MNIRLSLILYFILSFSNHHNVQYVNACGYLNKREYLFEKNTHAQYGMIYFEFLKNKKNNEKLIIERKL